MKTTQGIQFPSRDLNSSALEYETTAQFSTAYHAMELATWKIKTRYANKSFTRKHHEELCGRQDNIKTNVTLFYQAVQSLGAFRTACSQV
jgi:hypothetical protein